MLVLSRKKDECIVINNDITIVVVEIRGDKVRLGVEAPKEVPVHRKEVYEAIARDDSHDAGRENELDEAPVEAVDTARDGGEPQPDLEPDPSLRSSPGSGRPRAAGDL